MSRKRYTPEQIISMLREAEVALAQGQSIGQACRTLGVSEQSYYRWRKEYGGLRTDQAKRLEVLCKLLPHLTANPTTFDRESYDI